MLATNEKLLIGIQLILEGNTHAAHLACSSQPKCSRRNAMAGGAKVTPLARRVFNPLCQSLEIMRLNSTLGSRFSPGLERSVTSSPFSRNGNRSSLEICFQ